MPAAAVRAPDAVKAYALAVVAGEVVACEFVRLACARHLRDLREGKARGLRWNRRAAEKVIRFFDVLEHTKGRWAGKPLTLEPWQQFIVGSLFGWQRFSEEVGAWVRRFTHAYNEIPRKNGKSTMAAGVGNYLAFFDREAGADVYAAATKKDQAKIVWVEAQKQIKALRRKSAEANRRLRVMTSNLHCVATDSKYEPLGADSDTIDGLNGHAFTIDELHAHKTREMWDVCEESMASRSQPLLFAITTAGYNRHTICWEQRSYAVKVLKGQTEDDSYFAFVTTLDEGDDWTDPRCWPKANPNLGVSVSLEYLRTKVKKAMETPGLVNSTRQKHFNVWTTGSTRWLDSERWRALTPPPARRFSWWWGLRGRAAYGGLDLAGSIDLNAFDLVFSRPATIWVPAGYDVLTRFWMPRENVAKRVREDRVTYDVWSRDGWIQLMDGAVRDDDEVLAGIEEMAEPFEVKEIGVDPWQSPNIAGKLIQRGVEVVNVSQSYGQLAAPSDELEKQIAAGTLLHDGSPVMQWMVENVVADVDAAGNRKPSKKESTERIDGVGALVTALSRAVGAAPEPPKKKARYYAFGQALGQGDA